MPRSPDTVRLDQSATRPVEITRHIETEVLDTTPHPPIDVDLTDCKPTTRYVLTDDAVPDEYTGPREFTAYLHCPPRNPGDKTSYFTWPATTGSGNATTPDGDAVHAVEFYGTVPELRWTFRYTDIKSILDSTPGPDPDFNPGPPDDRDDLHGTTTATRSLPGPAETRTPTTGPGTSPRSTGSTGGGEPSPAHRGATGDLAVKYLTAFESSVRRFMSMVEREESDVWGEPVTVTDWGITYTGDPDRVSKRVAWNACGVSSPDPYESRGGMIPDPPQHVEQYVDVLIESVQVPETVPVVTRPLFTVPDSVAR